MRYGIDISDKKYILINLKSLLGYLENSDILITGGTGFMGKWLIETILYANEKLDLKIRTTVLSRNPLEFHIKYPHLTSHPEIDIIQGDIRNFTFRGRIFNFIIHAATEADAKLNVTDPLLMSDVIIQGTRHLLEIAVKCKTQRILFLSSGAVYGKQPETIDGFKEDFGGGPDLLAQGSSYAESKRMAEFLCATYARQYNLAIPIARCFAFVGPYLPLDTHYAIGNFINDGLHVRDITISGDGSPLRSYMYASDMVIWLLTILLKGNSGEAYNVGSDKAISIKDLAYTVKDFFPGIQVKILNQHRLTDRNQNYIPDIQKAKNQFNFQEGISLHDAILKTIRYYR